MILFGSLSGTVFEILFIWLILYFCWLLIRVYLSPLRTRLPGHKFRNPLLGNLLDLQGLSLFERWKREYERFGGIFRAYTFLCAEWVVVMDPDSIKSITQDNSANYYRGPMIGTGAFEQIVGKTSLLITKGELHRKHRALLSPAFRISNLRRLFPAIPRSTLTLCNHWNQVLQRSEGQKVELDVRKEMSRLTLTIIGLTSFGFDFECIGKEEAPLARALEHIIGIGSEAQIWHFIPYAYYLPVPRITRMWKGIRDVQQVFDSMIAASRASLHSSDSLLSIVLRASQESDGTANQPFSDKELRDELMTFILAGHETSSLALTWALYHLALHPNIQSRVRKECKAFEKSDEMRWEDVEGLSLTKAVVYETLRLRPPICFFPRTSREEATLGGYRIPAGTAHLVHLAQMQRHPQIWEDPEEFRPERFLEEDVPWRAWMPFGEGTHKCIGYKFALLEITAALPILLSRFKFSIAPENVDPKLQIVITMQPSGPVLLNVQPISTKAD